MRGLSGSSGVWSRSGKVWVGPVGVPGPVVEGVGVGEVCPWSDTTGRRVVEEETTEGCQVSNGGAGGLTRRVPESRLGPKSSPIFPRERHEMVSYVVGVSRKYWVTLDVVVVRVGVGTQGPVVGDSRP